MSDDATLDPIPSLSPATYGDSPSHSTLSELAQLAPRVRHPAALAALLQACIIESEGDARVIARALGVVVHAHGVRAFSERSGISCRMLRRELMGQRPPRLATIMRVTQILGMHLRVTVQRPDDARAPAN